MEEGHCFKAEQTKPTQDSTKFYIRKEWLQGDVLFPLLWSILVNELLESLVLKFKNMRMTQPYCSQANLYIRFPTDYKKHSIIVEKWYIQINLNINPKKGTIVPFIKRRSKDNLKNPSLFGEEIKYTYSQKVKSLESR